MIDTHIHSKFSADSDMPIEVACEKAISAGLSGITFTDHLDLDFPNFDDSELIDFNVYSRTMDRFTENYSKKLKVLKGIEVGMQPQVLDDNLKIIRSVDFDYVLASVHIIDGIDPYYGEYYRDKTQKEAYELYLQKILFFIKNFENFDHVGHFEYIIRYAGYDDRTLRYNNHTDVFEEILKTLISKGKGFEVNTGSFRDKPGIVTAEYDATVLKRFRELGGDLVSLGSDAHNEQYVGYKFDYFKDLMQAAGFTHVVHYEKRKPVYTRL